jgi:integrase
MSRPRRDGSQPRQTVRRRLTDPYVTAVRHEDRRTIVWDEKQRGLALITQAKPSTTKSWAALYYVRGRPRWISFGRTSEIGLSDARKMAAAVMLQAAAGKDPATERKAQRSMGNFSELAERHLNERAMIKNRSWAATDRLVRAHLLPKWGRLPANAIGRSDVRSVLAGIASPGVANIVLSAASAIFSFGIEEEIGGVTVNPCTRVARHRMTSRERVLSDSEVPLFWAEFDRCGTEGAALKTILLCGQRPGEVTGLRIEHIVDGWWQMPGEPVAELNWRGMKNKNDHRIWLSEPVQAILAPLAGKQPFGGGRLDGLMRQISKRLGLADNPVRPHDLRRSFSTKVAELGFGRDALNRVTGHREGGIASVYDRHGYGPENKQIMETVAAHIIGIVEGKGGANVIPIRR